MQVTESGRVLSGRYRLSTVIGRGGMGVVWRARDELLGRDVAVKEMIWPPHLTEQEQQVASRRATREAQMAARLSHHNVVRIYDIVEEDDHPWIVMELLPYRSLQEMLAADGPLPPARAAQIGLGILAALRAAHAEDILHRDVKPANVLILPDGRAVLTDFGIARAADSPTVTTAGALIGSPSYIAPERARGAQSGPQADLWGLGASLYAAVEGHPPFERDGVLPTLTAVVADEPDPAYHAGPLWPVISGLLRKDPAARLDAAATERMLHQVAADGAASAETARVIAPAPPIPEQAAPEPGAAEPLPAGGDAPSWRPAADEAPLRSQRAPVSPARRSRGPLVALVAACAIAAAAIGVTLALTGAPGQPASPGKTAGHPVTSLRASASRTTAPRTTAPASSPTAPATGATSGAASASGEPAGTPGGGTSTGSGAGSGQLPSGWHRFTNSTGFSIGVPDGWAVSHSGHYVYVNDPANPNVYLLIDQSDTPKSDPLADWQQQAANRASSYPAYHLIRLEPVSYRPQAERAADWEFTYNRNGVPVHVLNRNILANAKHAYALYWSTPAGDWTADYHYFQSFAATFTPAQATG
jgi:tRNA A-37 threonylcarbamoyl transferase component Bud32